MRKTITVQEFLFFYLLLNRVWYCFNQSIVIKLIYKCVCSVCSYDNVFVIVLHKFVHFLYINFNIYLS